MFCDSRQEDWDVFIPAALFSYRVTKQEMIQETLFYLTYGRRATLPIDTVLLEPEQENKISRDYAELLKEKLKVAHETALKCIEANQGKMKYYFDRRAKESTFQVGDIVYLYTPKATSGLSKKLEHRWHGPYRTFEKVSPVNFQLQRVCDGKIF
uniref:Uncharacterized protein LOC102809442 n=1 Tax=Saccoglossus kowalevskii TaxID=10224 RepID=A0ABM0M5G9_SACKO|nr:PREDICTED: uncharacterized protein LOC102809442 [Saccoglossus kowalevskii]